VLLALWLPPAQAGITLATDSTVDASRVGIGVSTPAIPDEERLLLLALEGTAQARLDDAEHHLSKLLKVRPAFHLARVVLGDVLMARSGRSVDFASGAAGERLDALREEALARLDNARSSTASGRLPGVLLEMSPSQHRAVVVDVSASRLYLFARDRGVVRLERSYYVSTGKNGGAKRREGDQRTPAGVYFVTGRIDGNALPDFYGPGALPVNYPNEWDLRHGRTGYGIWIHGVSSNTFARAPRASDGCVALLNEYAAELLNLPRMEDTPVIIAKSLQWMDETQMGERWRALRTSIDAWRRAGTGRAVTWIATRATTPGPSRATAAIGRRGWPTSAA
jgi:hypothetical protein